MAPSNIVASLSSRFSPWSSDNDSDALSSPPSAGAEATSAVADDHALATGLGCAAGVVIILSLFSVLVFCVVKRCTRQTRVRILSPVESRRQSCDTIKSFVQFGIGADKPKTASQDDEWVRFSIASDGVLRRSCDTVITYPDVAYLSRKCSFDDDNCSSTDATLVGFDSSRASFSSEMLLDLRSSS